jgi:hypothetical protein
VSAVDAVWLRYPDTGGVARFPADAAEVWQARGWVPCEPPPEDLSYLRDPAPEPPGTQAVEAIAAYERDNGAEWRTSDPVPSALGADANGEASAPRTKKRSDAS